MTSMQRGFRSSLEHCITVSQDITVELGITGPAVYDTSCFGVDAAGTLSDDRYMVFFNQPASPGNEIRLVQGSGGDTYTVALSRLPDAIRKLVFTASIDGPGTMGDITAYTLTIAQNGVAALRLTMTGADFHQERAIIGVELYRKDGWRIAAVASGFDGGLPQLLKYYGGTELEPVEPIADGTSTPAPSPTPAPQSPPIPSPQPSSPSPPPPSPPPQPVNTGKLSLEKKLEASAPALVSLAKPLKVALEKRRLTDVTAKVGLVMDISGSMTTQYGNGTVQTIINTLLPIAVQFDDDGELDFWYYGSKPKRMPSITLRNYQSAVPPTWSQLMSSLGYSNNEPAVMQEIMREYADSSLPAYVMFITDGGVGSADTIKNLLVKASRSPIFWQFVGVGGSNYGILEDLDTMTGRYVDNANFFSLDDFNRITNSELYDRLLEEFPVWLAEIKRKGMR